MRITPLKLLVAGAVVVVASPALAMAASVNAGLTPTVQVDTSGTGIEANTGGSVNVGATNNTNGDSINSEDQLEASGTADLGGMTMLTITQQDAAGAPSTVTSSAMVSNDADFDAYAQSQLQQNPSLKEVDADGTSVTVKYAEPAQLFGFIPVTMTDSAQVTANGQVNISYPWYHFITTSSANESAISAGLATEASTVMNQEAGNGGASASATLSAQQEAQLLDGIRLVLAGNLGATASSTASY